MKIQTDMHTHTIASTHAYSTILENCQWAEKYGLKAIAMTDHAMGMPDSPHIWHFGNMKCLPRKISGVTVIRGAEVNIAHGGGLDVDDYFLNMLEWVVASMHYETYKPQSVKEHTEDYLKICKIPQIDVIAHSASDEFMYDYEPVIKAFKEYGKLVEINESSIINKKGVRKNYPEIIKLCKKYEVPVIVDSDSHFCANIGQVSNSLQMLDELDFPEKLVVNSDWEKIREHIAAKHPNADI